MNNMLFDSNSVIDIIEILRTNKDKKSLQPLKEKYLDKVSRKSRDLLTEINNVFDDEDSKVVSQYLATDNNHGNYYKLHNKLMSMYNSPKVSNSNKTKLFPLIVDNYKSFMSVALNPKFNFKDDNVKNLL